MEAWLKSALAFHIFLNKRKTDVSGNYSSVYVSNTYIKIETWNKSICKRLQRKKINMNNFYKFYQGLSSIEYHVFISIGGQDRPASQISSRSIKNLISTEVENR